VLVRALFQVAECWLVSSWMQSRARKLSLLALIWALILFMRVPPSKPGLIVITSQRPHLLVPSHWE